MFQNQGKKERPMVKIRDKKKRKDLRERVREETRKESNSIKKAPNLQNFKQIERVKKIIKCLIKKTFRKSGKDLKKEPKGKQKNTKRKELLMDILILWESQ